MTISHSSPSPSPSRSEFYKAWKTFISKSPQGQLLRIQLCVLFTIFLLVALLILGRFRRFVRLPWFLRCATKIIYVWIPIGITYIMGLMHNASTFHIMYPVWACCLVYAHGGVVTMTACDLGDNDYTLSYFWSTLPLFYWTVWLAIFVPGTGRHLPYFWIIFGCVILIVAVWNAMEKLQAFYLASKSKGLPGLVGPVVRYMREVARDESITDPDPVSMRGYRFLVWGDPEAALAQLHSPPVGSDLQTMTDQGLSEREADFQMPQPRTVTCVSAANGGAPPNHSTNRFSESTLSPSPVGADLQGVVDPGLSGREVDSALAASEDGHANPTTNHFSPTTSGGGPPPPLLGSVNEPADNTTCTFTTTEDIWNSVGRDFLANCEGVERLKDMCLSYAFFRLILRRFANCPVYEASQEKTRRFIWKGLLLSPSTNQPDPERVFRVLEVEHGFLFNFFYTKSYVCCSYKYVSMFPRIIHAIVLISLATFGISLIDSQTSIEEPKKSFNIKFYGHRLDIGVTRIVILIFASFEIWKFFMIFFSNTKMVWLLCTCSQTRKGRRIKETLILSIWTFKMCIYEEFAFLFKPWQRKLGQYSFLESYHDVPILSYKLFFPMGKLMKLPRVGQCGEFSVALSTQVKEAIVTSLIPHVQDEAVPLSQRTNIIPDDDMNVYRLENDAQVILVWHIAIRFCEALHAPQVSNVPAHNHFLVATQLSKYCAYLLAFAPELLPGYPYITECEFDTAVQQAKVVMQGLDGLGLRERYDRLKDQFDPEDNNHDDNIVLKGAHLACKVICRVLDQGQKPAGWRVLAEFWAELLLYLAPSDNAAAHGEYLASGGEFITLLWALLTHAGILSRN